LAESYNVDVRLLRATEQINHSRVKKIIEKVRESLWIIRGKTIGILGLSFKPGTDDIREAPSLCVIEELLKEGAILQLYDPKAMSNTKQVLPEQPGRVTYCENSYNAAREAHAVLILTEWEEFRELDLRQLRNQMSIPILIDGRNIYDFDRAHEAGLEYFCMGRAGLSKASANIAPASPRIYRKRSKLATPPEATPIANAAKTTMD
jgi:UDPglucose 6-dehydrogenase